MKSIHFHALLLIGIISLSACQNKKSNSNPEFLSLELLRGDITLCGGNQFGEVNFPFSCDINSKETFDLAISLLHSFEYPEAEKAFVKVMDADPDCAMAYWGVAMSMYHALWFAPNEIELEKGLTLIEYAASLPKTEREGDYLDAIGAYYKDWENTDHQTRAKRYEKRMEAMYKKYKDDTEAAIFYTLALNSTSDPKDRTYTNQRKAGNILESIFPAQPNHPGIAHYIIHNYDNPELALLALPTARRYAEIAPSSAHAQHMPSHIFTRLGLWGESIQSNINSADAARCYAEESDMDGNWDEEIHAMDYLVYAYLQVGDNIKANQQYQHLLTMDKLISLTGPYNFGAIPARIYLENKQWEKAADLAQHPSNVQWRDFPWELAITHFARVLGAAHTGDINTAINELAVLETLHQQLLDDHENYKANQVLIQVKASKAWIKYAQGDLNEALTLMRNAADMEDITAKHPKTPGEVIPASELLGDMLLAMNKHSQALEAYERDLKGHPNRFNGIYGAAVAAKRMGNHEKAINYFEELLKLTEGVDSDRIELDEAKAYLDFDTNI